MHDTRICAVITGSDMNRIAEAERIVDMFEVRIDLIGEGWEEVAAGIHSPWIATNRDISHGGTWQKSEKDRIAELYRALQLGASFVDLEMDSGDLRETVDKIKSSAKCIISHHDWNGTPDIDRLEQIIQRQMSYQADVCKLVTTATKFEDNITMLKVIKRFPRAAIISFSMGKAGLISRILSPLAGGYLTYVSMAEGAGSAPGQITLDDMHTTYGLLEQ